MLANMITALLIERFFSNLTAPVNRSEFFLPQRHRMAEV
jgi:hypothetical protein